MSTQIPPVQDEFQRKFSISGEKISPADIHYDSLKSMIISRLQKRYDLEITGNFRIDGNHLHFSGEEISEEEKATPIPLCFINIFYTGKDKQKDRYYIGAMPERYSGEKNDKP
jgi:hypothetical protein